MSVKSSLKLQKMGTTCAISPNYKSPSYPRNNKQHYRQFFTSSFMMTFLLCLSKIHFDFVLMDTFMLSQNMKEA